MNEKEKMLKNICKVKSKTIGELAVAELGAKYGCSGSTIRRIWKAHKEWCK